MAYLLLHKNPALNKTRPPRAHGVHEPRLIPREILRDGYKRPLVTFLSSNFQRFGMDKTNKVKSLREIIEEIAEAD